MKEETAVQYKDTYYYIYPDGTVYSKKTHKFLTLANGGTSYKLHINKSPQYVMIAQIKEYYSKTYHLSKTKTLSN